MTEVATPQVGEKPSRYQERKDAGRRPASMEFSAPLYARLQERALKEQRSMAAITRIAVEEYLDRNGG